MSHRHQSYNRQLFVIATLAVLLAGRGAFAERLGGAYRGPEDLTKSTKDSGGGTDTSGGGSSGSGNERGGPSGGGGGGGTGADSGGGGGGGGGGDSGGGGGGDSGGGGSGGGDGGTGSGTGGGSSSAGSGGKDSGGGGGGGSSGGGGGGTPKKSTSAQTQFLVASWFFEHNREALFHRFNESSGRRINIPSRSSGALFCVLPRDSRQRAEITTEDKDKIFDVLKKQGLLAAEDVVRDAAVIALGKLGTPQAVEALKAHFAKEAKTDVKQDTLLALGLARSAECVPILVETLHGDRTPKRELASFALLGLGLSQDHEKAAPEVLDYFTANAAKCEKERDLTDSVCSAAVALGALRHADAVGPLAKTLGTKNMPDVVRCYCAQALGKIRGDAALKALEDVLGNKNSEMEVARAAAIALGEFSDPAVAKILRTEGIDRPDPLTAGFAAISLGRVLGQIDEEEWKNGPDELRGLALKPEKDNIKSQYANIALSFFSGGFDANVRKWYASDKISKLDKDTQSAIAMASGLGSVATSRPELLALAREQGANYYVRGYAAMAVGMLGQATSSANETAAQLVEVFRGTDDPNVRRGAIIGLGFVGDRKNVPFLVTVLEAKEDVALVRYTRGAAVTALGMIRDGESIARIQGLIGASDPRTRAFAFAALGNLADKDERPALSLLFENANFRKDNQFPTLEAVMHQL